MKTKLYIEYVTYVLMILMSCFLELNSTHSSLNPYINHTLE